MKINNDKVQYDSNREISRSALSSGKIDKYEYFTNMDTIIH